MTIGGRFVAVAVEYWKERHRFRNVVAVNWPFFVAESASNGRGRSTSNIVVHYASILFEI